MTGHERAQWQKDFGAIEKSTTPKKLRREFTSKRAE